MIELFVDASTAGGVNVSAVGVFLRGEGHSIKWSQYVGKMDNHQAEFTALLKGLELARPLATGMVSIKSDSKLVVDAFEKRFVKNPVYRKLLDESLAIADGFDYCFIKWIPDSQNKAAHALANDKLKEHK
ncbi:ribonuclease HI family protein [Planococcus maitriensis]|uniref:Ribonuclease HI n=1 Tax=Planococcus maitriensis TaxID=221799 RepID=A0A365KBS2_9BACL|nr:ribonuclease HI family protein [Planococcus maitriensis]RAZ70228.1 ribonuclease HI [Planococcus maitriensis]